MHGLQVAFIKYIQREYGVMPGVSNMFHPEEKAASIRRLGIDYDLYVELACSMLDEWVELQGWKYPYWAAVTCDSTVKRIGKLLELAGDDALADGEYNRMFQVELTYAQRYIDWYIGLSDVRPKHNGRGRVCGALRCDVAQYICDIYGVEYLSSNYNDIAAAIERNLS